MRNRLLPFLPRADPATLRALVPLVKPRIKKLNEIAALVDFLFEEDLEYDPQLLIGKGMDAASCVAALRAAHATLEKYPAFDDEEKIEAELRADAEKLGMKNLQFFGALRVAVTGKTVSLAADEQSCGSSGMRKPCAGSRARWRRWKNLKHFSYKSNLIFTCSC